MTSSGVTDHPTSDRMDASSDESTRLSGGGISGQLPKRALELRNDGTMHLDGDLMKLGPHRFGWEALDDFVIEDPSKLSPEYAKFLSGLDVIGGKGECLREPLREPEALKTKREGEKVADPWQRLFDLERLNELASKAAIQQRTIPNDKDPKGMWRLPFTPLDLPDRQLFMSIAAPEVYYNRTCRLIKKNWNVDARECIPEKILKQTPYSFALLEQLRHLSSNTKHKFEMASKLLLESRKHRLEGAPPHDEKSCFFVRTPLSNDPTDPKEKNRENDIAENIYGLMVEDVMDVRKFLASRQYKQVQKTRKLIRTSERRAEEILERRRQDGTNMSETHMEGDNNQNGSTRPNIAPPDRSQARVHDEHTVAGTFHESRARTARPPRPSHWMLFHRDTGNIRDVMQAMQATGIEANRSRRADRRRRVRQAVAAAGPPPPPSPGRLPSERFDLNAMPSLRNIEDGRMISELLQRMEVEEVEDVGSENTPPSSDLPEEGNFFDNADHGHVQ